MLVNTIFNIGDRFYFARSVPKYKEVTLERDGLVFKASKEEIVPEVRHRYVKSITIEATKDKVEVLYKLYNVDPLFPDMACLATVLDTYGMMQGFTEKEPAMELAQRMADTGTIYRGGKFPKGY